MHTIAEQIIHKLGGFQRVADITGLDISRIYRWTYSKQRGGTDGLIPARHQSTLMRAAMDNGIEFTLADIVGIEPLNGHKRKRSKV